MTDIREEFARIAESRRKPPISASNIGYNCAIDEMIAELRALPPVCGGEHAAAMEDQVQAGCVALVELKSDIIGTNGRRKATTETIVRTVLQAADRLRSPSPPPVSAREESIRNAIAAMEQIKLDLDHSRDCQLGEDHGLCTCSFDQRYELLKSTLAALKREVG